MSEAIQLRGRRPAPILTSEQFAYLQEQQQAHNEYFDKVWAGGLGKEWKKHYFEWGKRLCDGSGTMPWARFEGGRKLKGSRCEECQKLLNKQRRTERKAQD